jgi:hypothetical protein
MKPDHTHCCAICGFEWRCLDYSEKSCRSRGIFRAVQVLAVFSAVTMLLITAGCAGPGADSISTPAGDTKRKDSQRLNSSPQARVANRTLETSLLPAPGPGPGLVYQVELRWANAPSAWSARYRTRVEVSEDLATWSELTNLPYAEQGSFRFETTANQQFMRISNEIK